MPSRADVTRLARGQRRIVDFALDDLRRLFAGFDLSSPSLVNEALLEVVPQLVREYGDLAATAAAEWYEEVRDAPGTFYARLGREASEEAVDGAVRYAARHLYTDDPVATLDVLRGSIQRHIAYSGRDTISRSAWSDPAYPRFARVPSGARTCAFCEMVASRGFVYASAKHAGEFEKYHDDCNCQIVPSWDAEQSHIEGYDPDAMYVRYKAAWDAAGGPGSSAKQVAREMRRLFPGAYTDGVHDD